MLFIYFSINIKNQNKHDTNDKNDLYFLIHSKNIASSVKIHFSENIFSYQDQSLAFRRKKSIGNKFNKFLISKSA